MHNNNKKVYPCIILRDHILTRPLCVHFHCTPYAQASLGSCF